MPTVTFLINGDGAARRARCAIRPAGLANVRFSGYQPSDRLPEVLATGDIHLVPLKAGSAASACRRRPTRSSPPAARCSLRSIPAPRCRASSPSRGGGVGVPPDDLDCVPRRVAATCSTIPTAGERDGRSTAADGSSEQHRLAAVARAYADLDRRVEPPTRDPVLIRGGDSLASSWLRHHPPKKLPDSPREARARRFASKAARFSRSPSRSSSCSACCSSSTAVRADRATVSACRGSTTAPTSTPTGTPPSASTSATRSSRRSPARSKRRGSTPTATPVLLNDKFRILGIHSHGDGIIHYHPASTKSSGNRAKLGVFLD